MKTREEIKLALESGKNLIESNFIEWNLDRGTQHCYNGKKDYLAK